MATPVEFEGHDLSEAIAAAAETLNLPPEKLKFNIVTMGAKGFLGLGRRRARVSVDLGDPVWRLPGEEAPAETAETAVEAEPVQPGLVKKPSARQPAPRSGRAPAPPLDFSRVPPPLTRPAAGEEPSAEPGDEAAGLAQGVVRDILNHMGLAADISAVRLGSRLVLNLDGPDKALLIGTRGATLEALQLLAAKIVARQNPAAGRLVLDVADYRARRQSHILENLRQVAETVRRTRQPQNMPGLNAAEKRLAQRALRPFKDLSARTEGGRGGLVIAPAAAVPKPRPKSRRRTAEPA